MQPIIGLEFGNFNTFTCFISDFDIRTRMGGTVHDLLPPRLSEGIPSIYFYSEKVGEVLVGENANRTRAVPLQNRLRYLKRHLGESTVLDGRTISYDKAITEVIQHCIRSANKQLHAGWQMHTNLVSLSYPATYTFAQRQRLIELVERATLEDGTKVKVYGTIAEPAAAALDYLAEFVKSDRDTTVLTYDLGGGTFDLGLVSVYPKGRQAEDGHTYYYDIINTRGIAKLGGAEFDQVMFELMVKKVDVSGIVAATRTAAALRNLAETTKVELSTSEEEIPQLYIGDDYVDIPVTRKEFEDASRELLMKTIEETRKILQDHPNQKPEIILLTGGASQMPMVKRELERAFPEYQEKIIYYRPSRAIAYGAARFGTTEKNTDPTTTKSIVQQHAMYDLGVRYFYDEDDSEGYITVFIKAGTAIPYTSTSVRSTKLSEGQYSRFRVYEANKPNPDLEDVENDFTEIMAVVIDHGRKVPKDHPHESRMNIDKNGVLMIEARDASAPDMPFEKASVKLENLS